MNNGHTYYLIVNIYALASQKLHIDGCVLVLEKDGTMIDENEALRQLHQEIFMLLTKEEKWIPSASETTQSLSTCFTVMVVLHSLITY